MEADSCHNDAEKECRCRAAALRAYDGMMQTGVSPAAALGAAIKVHQFYHPGGSPATSQLTVETWVRTARAH